MSLMALPTTKCFDFQKWAASTEIVSGILDFAVAGIAIGSLRHLQMNVAQKTGLLVLFLLTALYVHLARACFRERPSTDTFCSVAIIGAVRISLTYQLNTGGRCKLFPLSRMI
jgi:hypothetical protein